MNRHTCPVCSSQNISLFKEDINNFCYYECINCKVIFISPDIIYKMDLGESLVTYSDSYWNNELNSCRVRSWGSSLARIAELFLYARITINKFVDIGTGPGYLLDALSYQLPSSVGLFYGAELFPPEEKHCTGHLNYHKGSFLDFDFSFDAGSCIEVIEHITPAMFKQMMTDLAVKSKPNSIYIFNTGMVDYIKNEDIGYLDPLLRGHIIGWSIQGLKLFLEPLGFKISSLPGKNWAFIAEYKPNHNFANRIDERIWSAFPENLNTLRDKKTGELMYVLGLDTARVYG